MLERRNAFLNLMMTETLEGEYASRSDSSSLKFARRQLWTIGTWASTIMNKQKNKEKNWTINKLDYMLSTSKLILFLKKIPWLPTTENPAYLIIPSELRSSFDQESVDIPLYVRSSSSPSFPPKSCWKSPNNGWRTELNYKWLMFLIWWNQSTTCKDRWKATSGQGPI